MIRSIQNTIRLVLLLLLLSTAAYGQPAYQGQLYITAKSLSVFDGKLNVVLNISYEGLALASDESLTLTPVLKYSSQLLELPSILINGTFKQKAYHRAQVLSSGSHVTTYNPTDAAAMVVENDSKTSRLITYKFQVNYAPWMKHSMLFLRTRECGCNGKPACLYEDKIAEGVQLPHVRTSPVGRDVDKLFLGLVNIVPITGREDLPIQLRGTIPPGLFGESEARQAKEIYLHLRNVVRSLQQQSGTNITGLKITGYGAPQGNYRKNERDASLRAVALKNYLRETYLVSNVPIDSRWVAEDWDSIRSLVSSSAMPLRQAVTDIINTIDVNKGRERMLMQLADGTSYKYLWDHIFPRVRRVEYTISYTQHYRLDTAEGRRLFEMGSHTLKLSEFFAVAMSYPKGSNEYNDAFDLAARLFPESPEAAINAAAVALSKRDTKKARGYLEKYATLPLAYNNMGVLHLLEGNRDKAEVYLQMAVAAGVKEAQVALTYLRGGQGNDNDNRTNRTNRKSRDK